VAGELITAEELEELLSDLAPIGRGEDDATTRLAWTREDLEAADWFARRAVAIGRRMERDPAGNLWAFPDDGAGPWWATGSHLDTVARGGRFDGALGVAAAFAVAARLPVAVVSFADEEGARFNTPTFGSRALTGRLDVDDAVERMDRAGVTLGDAMAEAGVDPDGLARAPEWLDRLAGFVELHIDQTRDLAAARVPCAPVARLAARMRVQATLTGRADHAGTTRREERHDALAAAARLIVRADDLAAEREDMLFTAARIEVEPNAATTVPSLARLWMDARAAAPEAVTGWRETLEADAGAIAARAGAELALRTASWSAGTAFPADVRESLARGCAAAGGGSAPLADLVCFAGHDAGVIAAERPAGMVFVRNPTGISHAPEERVSLEDAAVAANALLAALRELSA
jgi:beta-ureidopropionase / N-carbamoyl-L-amino-acid hydrolase